MSKKQNDDPQNSIKTVESGEGASSDQKKLESEDLANFNVDEKSKAAIAGNETTSFLDDRWSLLISSGGGSAGPPPPVYGK